MLGEEAYFFSSCFSRDALVSSSPILLFSMAQKSRLEKKTLKFNDFQNSRVLSNRVPDVGLVQAWCLLGGSYLSTVKFANFLECCYIFPRLQTV